LANLLNLSDRIRWGWVIYFIKNGGKIMKKIKDDRIKKDIMIRGLQNGIWMKFRELCKEHDQTANYGVKRLIRKYVKEREEAESCNSKK